MTSLIYFVALLLPTLIHADNSCAYANDGYCDEEWYVCEPSTDDADCSSSSDSILDILQRLDDGKTGKHCSTNDQCPSNSCKGNTASTSNCCMMRDGYCSYCEGVIGTGLCGSCIPGYFMDLEKDDLFERYCTKCPSGKTTAQGYTQYKGACHDVSDTNPPTKDPSGTLTTSQQCDKSKYAFDCTTPGSCSYDENLNKDCTYRNYNTVECGGQQKCVYEKSYADASLEEGEQFLEGTKDWESMTFGEYVTDNTFGDGNKYRTAGGSWNIFEPMSSSSDSDSDSDEKEIAPKKFKNCLNVNAAAAWNINFCVIGHITSSHFELKVSLGVDSLAAFLVGDIDPLGIEIGTLLKLGPGTIPTEENPAMCKFPQTETTAYAKYMSIKAKVPIPSYYEDGAVKLNFLDFVPGKAGAIMRKFGLELGLEFQLDKLYNGGMQFSLLLFFGSNPFNGAVQMFREKVNLVELFQIPDAVDCSSEKMKGKKCLIFGNPANEKDTCSGTTQSTLLSTGRRDAVVETVLTCVVLVMAAMILM